MARVVTFGELLLRLTPQEHLRFSQAYSYNAAFGGAEANTAVCLSNFGVPTAFVSCLPGNEIAQSGIMFLRRHSVDTSFIYRHGDRIGIYFLEQGASQRPSKVIYDRAHSAMSCAIRTIFNWDEIFSSADWFHLTGITPALGGELPVICLDALTAAKKNGLTVSFDVNYRSSLLSLDAARQAMESFPPFIDVLISNEEQLHAVFGDNAQLRNKRLALTYRSGDTATVNDYYAAIMEGETRCVSKTYRIDIVDRIGSGDAFSAGLIYAMLRGFDMQACVDFAAATGCLKHSIQGDACLVSANEVLALMRGGDGRIQR